MAASGVTESFFLDAGAFELPWIEGSKPRLDKACQGLLRAIGIGSVGQVLSFAVRLDALPGEIMTPSRPHT